MNLLNIKFRLIAAIAKWPAELRFLPKYDGLRLAAKRRSMQRQTFRGAKQSPRLNLIFCIFFIKEKEEKDLKLLVTHLEQHQLNFSTTMQSAVEHLIIDC